MKKLYLLTIPILLAGCQATLPEKPEAEFSDNHTTMSSTRYHTAISKPSYIEQSPTKAGEYPQQFKYIIANSILAQPETLFNPIEYDSTKGIRSWGTCYIQKENGENKYYLALIKNNKIIENITQPAFEKTCNDLESQQKPLEQINHNKLKEQALPKFSTLVDDPSQFHLFGEPPKNPIDIMKTQLNFFLEDPGSSEWTNLSVRKTFLVSNDKVIYCYLVFANLRTKNITNNKYGASRNAIFYIKDNKILDHQIFSTEASGLKATSVAPNLNNPEETNLSLLPAPRVKQSLSNSSAKKQAVSKKSTAKKSTAKKSTTKKSTVKKSNNQSKSKQKN